MKKTKTRGDIFFKKKKRGSKQRGRTKPLVGKKNIKKVKEEKEEEKRGDKRKCFKKKRKSFSFNQKQLQSIENILVSQREETFFFLNFFDNNTKREKKFLVEFQQGQ